MSSVVALGDRVQVEPAGDVATVRFVGAVEGTDGAWVGVEFDASGRGKHDGTHEGARYFSCLVPGAGAFVRPHKLRPGVSLLHALRTKYELGNTLREAEQTRSPDQPAPPPASSEESQMYVHSARGHRVVVELCMKDELVEGQRHLDRLTRAYLPDAGVNSIGPRGDLAAHAGNITVLDLQGSLLRDWPEVERLNEELPKLHVLDLSRVRIALPVLPPSGTPFACLRTLVLNESGLSWLQVCGLQPLLPALEELHMCSCGISVLGEGVSWPRLKVLNLEDNVLADWTEVEHLALQPALEQLHLSNNRLASVRPPLSAACFARLRTLLLAGNALADWLSVDALDAFPCLAETRLTATPLVDLNPQTRHEVVARVSRLTMLNGSLVGRAERRDAEIRYLRRALDEAGGAEAAGAADAPAATRHPRMTQLLSLFGELAPGGGGGGGSKPVGGACLADDMLTLTLTCVAAGAAERAAVSKRLPRTTTVAALKQLCHRLFRVPAQRMALFVRRPGAPLPEALAEEQRDLHWLGVADGDAILVDQTE